MEVPRVKKKQCIIKCVKEKDNTEGLGRARSKTQNQERRNSRGQSPEVGRSWFLEEEKVCVKLPYVPAQESQRGSFWNWLFALSIILWRFMSHFFTRKFPL